MKRPPIPVILLALLGAAPVLAYFFLFFQFSVNIPFGDDYAVLSFVIKATNPHEPAKIPLLFSQHNEHRIVTLRLALLACYEAVHKVDFVFIALLGNIGLLGIAWLLSGILGDRRSALPDPAQPSWARAAVWLPVVLLVFQPQHREILNWAMCSFTNVYAIVFSFLSLSLLIRGASNRSFILSIVVSALAAYTNGNGIFVFIVGFFVLLFLKKFRRLAWWTICGIGYVGFYFRGYVTNPDHPDAIAFLKSSFLEVVRYFFAALGSFADFGLKSPLVPVAAGVFVFTGAWIVLWKLRGRSVLLTALTAFLGLSFAANALTRAPMGLEMAFMPRYKLLSVLALLLLYEGALELFKRKKAIALAFTVCALFFSSYSFLRNYPQVRDNKAVMRMNMVNWNARKADLPYPNQEHAETILRFASKRHIYQPPQALNIRRPTYPFGALEGGLDAELEGREAMVFSGWALDDGGRPSVIIRRERWASDPAAPDRSDGLVYVGKATYKNESVPRGERSFYGFPGIERMVWEFRLKSENSGAEPPPSEVRLRFFARDRIGQETYIGARTVRFPR